MALTEGKEDIAIFVTRIYIPHNYIIQLPMSRCLVNVPTEAYISPCPSHM